MKSADNSFDKHRTQSTATLYNLGTTVNQAVGTSPDSDDFFRFTAASSGRVTANLTGLSADIDLRALNSSGEQIVAGVNSGNANESFGFDVVANQTYYLRVDPWGAVSSTYSLTTSFVATPPPDTTPRTADLFSSNGQQLATLSSLAQQAYHLALGETTNENYNNRHDPHVEYLISVQPRWLTPTDLPTLVPDPVGGNFLTKGLQDGGVYVNQNAAALVGVTTDALFLTFRGTNDNASGNGLYLLGGGTPDTDHWFDNLYANGDSLNIYGDEGMAEHYALFAPLIEALRIYLDNNPQLLKVYVSGHSLGAAMAQQYMLTHLGSRYEAVLFASPGYGIIPNLTDDLQKGTSKNCA